MATQLTPDSETGVGGASGEDRTRAMTGGADEKVKTEPSPSAEEASPAPQPITPKTPG